MLSKSFWIVLFTAFITAFTTSIITIYYQTTIAWRLRLVDEQLDINTRFKTDDVTQWLVPQKSRLTVSRLAELPSGTPYKTYDISPLFSCCIAPETNVKDIVAVCPQAPSWYTGYAISTDKENCSEYIKKTLKNGILLDERAGLDKDGKARIIKTAAGLIAELDREYGLLEEHITLAHNCRKWGNVYRYSEYPQQWLFGLLRASYYLRYFPQWAIDLVNKGITSILDLHIPHLIRRAKEQTKQKTWWLFHGHVDRKIERMFDQLKIKLHMHGYLHNYWPYYHCLLQVFDLEVRYIDKEILRLMRRNRELMRCVQELL